MHLHRYQRAADFLALARPALEAQEIANGLLLGVVTRLYERPEWTDTPPYLAIAAQPAPTSGEAAVLMAAITPPHNLLLAAGLNTEPDQDGAIELLIQNLRQEGWAFPGVVAEKGLAERFARAWQAAAGAAPRIHTRLRCYELRQVIPPDPPAPGFLRPAAPDDLELMAAWREAFSYEALREAPQPTLRQHVQRLIEAGVLYVWDDQGPVSTAAVSRPTPHGISISAVYTPPERRGRGYASACVAELSQQQLDGGRDFCSLFTDLDYPTSNSVYQKIGYRPVCDFTEYAFS